MTADTWIARLAEQTANAANNERARTMAAYMKNNFVFYGVPAPERKLILKEHWVQHLLKPNEINLVVQKLWQLPQREMHYNAMDLLGKRKNKLETDDLNLIEQLITSNSWWDSVDYLAGTLLGAYFLKFPQEVYPAVERWENGNNLWLHRSAIIFQLKYREHTDLDLLFYLCTKFSTHKDFFIRKAIGWALRSVHPYKMDAVLKFVNEQPLSPLSKREALKHHKTASP
jgi:3-methyladenine DNA glycosylase AlkD